MSNVSQHLLSGALSGFASGVCLQPFDLLKTRMQQGDGRALRSHTMVVLETARGIVRTHGVLGLWRGTAPTILRNVPGVAMYFTGLNYVRLMMATSPHFASVQTSQLQATAHGSVLPKLTSQGNLLAGAVTRTAVGYLLNPFAVLKTRYESNLYAYNSLTRAFMSILRAGPSELFRGFLPSALRDAPYAGLFVVFYEAIKTESASYILPPTSAAISTGLHSFSAATAGAIATVVTHPFDVVKTKIQVRTEQRYHGLLQTIRTIWEQRGPLGFFDGMSLRMSRKILSSAIGWAVYEGILIFLHTAERKHGERTR